MSTALFKDTVTLYCYPSPDSSSCLRRILHRVKTVENLNSGGRSAVLYIPIHGKRSLKYLSPADFSSENPPKGAFTVRPGDRFVSGVCASLIPPEEAYTVSSVTEKRLGTLRIRHIKVLGSFIPVSEEATI